MTLKPAVFFDRDGTLNVERDYVRSLEEFTLVPGLVDALGPLQDHGLELVVITNQSGVARGYLTRETLDSIHDHLHSELRRAGIRLAGIYACLHHPDDRCACRKPAPGLLHQAQRDLGLDLRRSYVVGDRWSDIRLGRQGGCAATVLIENDRYAEEAARHQAVGEATFSARDLQTATQWIGDHYAQTQNR